MIQEGVLFGANAANPEYCPAACLSESYNQWDGRPLVMNHPQVQGAFVSANIPSVMQDWAFGYVFNTTFDTDTNKLHAEAWFDVALAEEKGGEFQDAVDRLNAGEVIEVSTGLYCQVVPAKGSFRGQAYSGVWQKVTSDHLAILSNGVKGACSVEDGCGIPRIQKGVVQPPIAIRLNGAAERTFRTDDTNTNTHDCGGNCGQPCCTGDETVAKPGTTTTTTPTTNTGTDSPIGKPAGGNQDSATQPNAITAGGFGTDPDGDGDNDSLLDGDNVDPMDLDDDDTSTPKGMAMKAIKDQVKQGRLRVHKIAPGLLTGDVVNILQQAVKVKFPEAGYIYIIDCTTDVAIFVMYAADWSSSDTYQIPFNIDASGNIKFTGDPTPVILLTTIQPKPTVNAGGSEAGANPAEGTAAVSTTEGDPMANGATTDPKTNQGAAAPAGDGNPTTTTGAAAVAPVVNTEATPTATRFSTVEEALAAFPPEIRSQMEAGMKLQAKQKADFIAKIKGNAANKFTDEQLNGMDNTMLEGLAALAETAAPIVNSSTEVAPMYAGRYPSTQEVVDDSAVDPNRNRVQGREEQGNGLGAPLPPRVFGGSTLGLRTQESEANVVEMRTHSPIIRKKGMAG
jgi:hypothetical protein